MLGPLSKENIVSYVDRQVGTLGWVFLGAVLAVVLLWAAWAIWWAPVEGPPPGPVGPADGDEDPSSPGYMRITEAGLLEWLKEADPIAECQDGRLLTDLSRGAHATSKMSRSFGNADTADRWAAVAIAAYERLAELSEPGKGSPYRRISELYLSMDNAGLAVDFERKHVAWKEDAGQDPGRLALGRLLLDAGRHEEALTELERAALAGPDEAVRAEANILMADCFEMTKRPAQAVAACGRAIDNARKGLEALTPEAFDSRGTFLIRPTRPGEGVATVSQIGATPDSPAVTKLVDEQGYKIINEQMRAKQVREIQGLLTKAAEKMVAVLYEMGRRDEDVPASQPANEELPTSPLGTAP